MSSGEAIEIRIWSNTGAGACDLKMLVISFIGCLLMGAAGATVPVEI
jgi:hypothetical protein